MAPQALLAKMLKEVDQKTANAPLIHGEVGSARTVYNYDVRCDREKASDRISVERTFMGDFFPSKNLRAVMHFTPKGEEPWDGITWDLWVDDESEELRLTRLLPSGKRLWWEPSLERELRLLDATWAEAEELLKKMRAPNARWR
ncbi:hypothetical protein [Streptomyces sp. NPDC059874]|uniref:hypothetical protein n=1 Tax=Streptomyces sp. NPDC059874 TaxID=3346983 RepID=UPI0036577F14